MPRGILLQELSLTVSIVSLTTECVGEFCSTSFTGLFSLPNNLFCLDNIMRIYTLINCLGLKGLTMGMKLIVFYLHKRFYDSLLISGAT